MNKVKVAFFNLILMLFAVGCTSQNPKDVAKPKTGDTQVSTKSEKVYALPIRKIKEGVSIEDFKAARDAYVALLEKEKGTLIDREAQPFFDFLYTKMPLDKIYVGFTSFQNQSTLIKIGQKLEDHPETINFFSKFDFIAFEVLQPLDKENVDLAKLAPLGSDQVWEIAIRDISKYTEFEQKDYEQKRDAYLKVLSEQKGFVQEIQWQSVLKPEIVVGMTIYKNAAAVSAINQNPDFIKAYKATGFIQKYPPNVFGMISKVLK